MLDAHPAPDALARPQFPATATEPPHSPPRPAAGDALFAAARTLLPALVAGRPLDAAILREAMTGAFGASDSAGAWLWKDAYEAAEAAAVLFLQRYGRAMRLNAGAGPDGPRRMLAMLDAIAALEPSHTKRSEEQVRLQQFSTPLPLAYAALQAAAIRPGDTVLEPSAGTGMLAVMAECALGKSADRRLHLNEYAHTRARLLTRLFPQAVVTAVNAEAIADRLHDVRPAVVLMNPPFSATPGVDRIRHDADLRHVRSAFSMLPPGGRLVTIVSAGCVPGDTAWTDAFARLDPPARCLFTMAIDGRAYARRGTGFDTRLTVLQRSSEPGIDVDREARAADAAELLDAVISRVPPRLPIEPAPIPAGPARDLFGKAVAPKPAKPRTGARPSSAPTPQARDWGSISELVVETGPVQPDAADPGAASTGPYAPWRPGAVRVAGAVEHPTPLVQSAAMAAVPHPAPAWRPMLPERVVTGGLLSDAQLESVVLAGEAHSRHLAAQYRIGSGWEAEAQRDALIEKLAALPPVPTALDQIVQRFGHEAVAEVTGRSRRVLRITDAKGERLSLRSRPASANLAETAAFMDGTKRILVFSMAGGTGRSYHADLSCANTERRIHYLLEPGWRADQAIQGLGRTHRTHQASAPLFRPVTTDVKGERRFIATIARRLDSLGAITRGQRDSQTAMGGSDAALFRESDNLESAYAKAALRQFYSALWRGRIEGWNVERFQDSTGLKIVHEGGLKDDLPPMPKFLNRLLALPIAEQNQLFAELEERIAANIEQAIEAGSYEVGVETVIADSLAVAGRETLYEHPGTGAVTELVEIVRRDKLDPLAADAALALGARDPGPDGEPRLVFNTRSQRAAVVLPAPSRMFDDGGVQERVQLIRPATRDRMAKAELDASNWRKTDEGHWRMLWKHEVGELPSHRESRFWLATGLLLPVWDRLPAENMRVRRLTSDDGISLIGRVLDAEQVAAVRTSFGLDGGPAMTGAQAFEAVMERGNALALANGWRLARRRLMGGNRVEIQGPADTDLPALKRMGCSVEIVSWRTRVFVPNAGAIERILDRWPLAA